MATVKHDVTRVGGWVTVATTEDPVLIENVGTADAHVTFGAAPAAGAAFHILRPNEKLQHSTGATISVRGARDGVGYPPASLVVSK